MSTLLILQCKLRNHRYGKLGTAWHSLAPREFTRWDMAFIQSRQHWMLRLPNCRVQRGLLALGRRGAV